MKKILIVEDEFIINLDLKITLLRANYFVDSAFSTEEAVLKISSSTFDLILMDINLNGDPLAGINLAKKFMKAQPIIFITAQEEELTLSEIKELSLPYINKPYNKEALLSLIKKTFSDNHN